MKQVSKKKSLIRSIVFFIIGMVVAWFLISNFMIFVKFYFHLKNGSKVELQYYQIDLPHLNWVRLDSTDSVHALAGGRINDKNLFANIAIDKYEVEVDYLLDKCDNVTKENKQFNDINGTMYLCDANNSKTMYFYSDDGYFLLQTDTYSSDEEIVNRYEELLNSINKQAYYLPLKQYQIKLPSPHWIRISSNKTLHTLSGGWINHKGIFAHITAVDWHGMEMNNLLNKKCTTVYEEKKQFSDVNGTIYSCENNTSKVMYFYSDDGYLLLRADEYFTNQKNIMRYEELLNSIQKISSQ